MPLELRDAVGPEFLTALPNSMISCCFIHFHTISCLTELAVHSATELTQVLVVVVIVSLNSFRPGASPTLDQAGTFPV